MICAELEPVTKTERCVSLVLGVGEILVVNEANVSISFENVNVLMIFERVFINVLIMNIYAEIGIDEGFIVSSCSCNVKGFGA